jgi:hypothetical protein
MAVSAIFPGASQRAGMYESFYLRAFSPDRPRGVWIRYTVHKRPGAPPRGSVWCTLFDAARPQPFMHKLTSERLSVPVGGWIEVDGATLGPGSAEGACGAASWSLRYSTVEPELRHLSPEWLYRAPLPRTKLTSPAPGARFEGTFELAGESAIDLGGWRGMVGHNWGAEHAERWIWLHGAGFEGQPEAWLDVALGRLKLAGRMTPWVANGVLALDGRRHRLGGLAARGMQVRESPSGCTLRLPGRDGLVVECQASAAPGTSAGWRYADPDGGEHDVLNCSIARLELSVTGSGSGADAVRTLRSAHGAAYELGMRERDHGVALAPFSDG